MAAYPHFVSYLGVSFLLSGYDFAVVLNILYSWRIVS